MTGSGVDERLSNGTLDRVDGAITTPPYRRDVPPTIVHLGVGAFARAHLATYADDLLRLGHAATIHGVSLRSPDAEARLAPQDGLFTLVEREPRDPAAPRVVGSLVRVSTGADAAVAALADPATTLVALTVTEKGYLPGPGSAAEVVARGLDARRRAGHAPPVVVSLDNVAGNGRVLRAAVLDAASAFAPDACGWIDAGVAFPSSVVDRMVPATTDADRAEASAALGLVDEAVVAAERHRSWAIDDAAGLPPFGEVGVEVGADVAAAERRKLWLLNGPHSAVAYLGLLGGHATIADATGDADLMAAVRALVDDTLAVSGLPADPARRYADDVLARFANPALGHTCRQVGTDGSRKLRERLLPVVGARLGAGLPVDRFAPVVAAWIAAVGALPVAGRALPALDDPAAPEVRAAIGRRDLAGAVAAGLPEAPRPFAATVDAALRALTAPDERTARGFDSRG